MEKICENMGFFNYLFIFVKAINLFKPYKAYTTQLGTKRLFSATNPDTQVCSTKAKAKHPEEFSHCSIYFIVYIVIYYKEKK